MKYKCVFLFHSHSQVAARLQPDFHGPRKDPYAFLARHEYCCEGACLLDPSRAENWLRMLRSWLRVG